MVQLQTKKKKIRKLSSSSAFTVIFLSIFDAYSFTPSQQAIARPKLNNKKIFKSEISPFLICRNSPRLLEKELFDSVGDSNDTNKRKIWTIDGPPLETKPDYENIHGPLGKWVDKLFLVIFRSKMAEQVGIDSSLPKTDYQGLMELTAALNARYSDRREVQSIAQAVLRSLFPSWLPGQFAILFAKPFPKFSSRMNAWATKMAGTWLMGECELNDCEIDGGEVGINQGILVKRCRYLEDSKCASICVNSCKIPTQKFFNEDMGLPLTMTPDYETGECQFSFGLTPDAGDEFDAKNTPCFSKCPSSKRLRQWHSSKDDSLEVPEKISLQRCDMMDN